MFRGSLFNQAAISWPGQDSLIASLLQMPLKRYLIISTTNHAIIAITSINTIIAITTTTMIITCMTWAKLSQDGLGPFFERTPLIARKVFSAGRNWRNGAEEPP